MCSAIGLSSLVVLLVILSNQPTRALDLRSYVLGGEAILTADTDRFAGAISSFTWKHVEFIDRKDHGRELQSAAQFDGLGACYNPTEAGSQNNGGGGKSSSHLLAASSQNDELRTSVDAAFWLAPGTSPGVRGCGDRGPAKVTANATVTGGYIIDKAVRFGVGDLGNRIVYDVTFRTPRDHEQAQFESVTAYLPGIFSRMFVLINGTLQEDFHKGAAFVQKLDAPVVFSTQDKSYALGVQCANASPLDETWAWYFDQANVYKFSCLERRGKVAKGAYRFRDYLFFGSLNEVGRTLEAQGAHQ